MRDMHDIDSLMGDTVKLRDTAEKLDSPLKDSLKAMIQQGRGHRESSLYARPG